jgi:branched-chain amino acid transport system permease protein
MEIFVQTIVGGLAAGSLYGLAALGIVILFNTSGVLNFAQGEMGMFSTFIGFCLMSRMGLPYWAALALAICFAILLAMAIERGLMRRVRDAPDLAKIILTLGVFYVLNGSAGAIWGFDSAPFPKTWQGDPFRLGSIVLDRHVVVVLVTTILISLIMYLLFKKSLVGIGMRAVSQDITTTRLMGAKIDRLIGVGWALAGSFAAIAGIFIAPVTFMDPNMMLAVLIKAFAAMVLGGFTSMPGAIIGGLLLGASESIVAVYISTDLKTVFSFSMIVVLLVIMPNGLLGSREGKKV